MTGSYFHLTNTVMKLLGLPLAIFLSLLKKLTFMAIILLLWVQLMLGITHQNFLKILSDIYLLIKSKKLCQMPFLQSVEINCKLSDISN